MIMIELETVTVSSQLLVYIYNMIWDIQERMLKISLFERENREKEELADGYAADSLIAPDRYEKFVKAGKFSF